MSDLAIQLDDVTKRFGDHQALRGVTFSAPVGSVLGVLGPNGAGKTTTINILATLLRPTSGTATIAGFDVVRQARQVRESIGLTGQYAAVDELLTGRENLILFARLRGMDKTTARDRADEMLATFSLTDAGDKRVTTYSGGMRRRVDIACGLVVRPEVVFLDEPTTGLDPRSRQAIWDLVTTFKAAGIATLLTTQYLEEADGLSDRIIVIDRGTIVAQGTADDLKKRTGGTVCEIVPSDPTDVFAVADALGSLLPAASRAAITADSDRVSIPAPDGPGTLGAALSRLTAASIDLDDIGLRKPSLDDVFLSLTGDSASEALTVPMYPTGVSR